MDDDELNDPDSARDEDRERNKPADALGPGTFLRVVRGDQLAFDVTVNSDTAGFDLHNYQIYFTASSSRNSPNPPVIKKSRADGSIIVTGLTTCRVTLTSQDTLKLPNQNLIYKFDVRIQDNQGTAFTVFSGDLEIRASSSQPSPGINFPPGAPFFP